MAIQTGIINHLRFKRSFCAIFVHSCDANLVHRFLDLIYLINIELNKYNIRLYGDTIHDSFALSREFILLLKLILFRVYNDFYTSSFREDLQKNLTETEKEFIQKIINKSVNNSFTAITNTNFVRI